MNTWSVYAMCTIGNGREGLKLFLMPMNHPPPMHEPERNYRRIGYTIYDGVKNVADARDEVL